MRTRRRAVTYTMSSTAIVVMLVVGAWPAPAAVPGANGMIAFASRRDGNYEVYVMEAEGSGQTNLTNSPGFDSDPAWSPDGSSIAFSSDRDGDLEVYVMNADGSGQTNLTSNPGTDFQPAWSPDGSRIAFSSDRDGDLEVYVMNADGSGQTNLTSNPGTDFQPAWSPDGSRIAFASLRDANYDVYVMNADGSGQTNLTRYPKGDDFDPAWSPDGSKIAFASGRGRHLAEVLVMNADGSGQTNLTNNNAASDFGPAWSPDGSKIAFASSHESDYDVFLMNADGSGTVDRLTTDPEIDLGPDWQAIPSADLALGLAASPNVVKPNHRLTYAISVENAGPSSAGDVVLTDVLPSQTTFVSVTASRGSCEAPPPDSTGTIICSLGTLANGDAAATSITVTVVAKRTTIIDTATVTSATPDPNTTNNSGSVTTPVG